MVPSSTLIAQDPAPAAPAAPPAGGGSIFGSPLIIIPLIGLYLLVVVLPMNRRAKREAAQKLADIKPGAKVVTSSGIVGTIVKAKDGEPEVTIRTEDSRLRVLRSTITTITAGDEAAGDAK